MIYNAHLELADRPHSFLSPSKFYWLNYDEEKLKDSYLNWRASEEGTELHELAALLIKKQRRQADKDTFGTYVNDAIGFRMDPEIILYYSDNCYGTADAINFNQKQQFLRIHDLKTGKTPAHMEQLMIYAALFCLEYKPIVKLAKLKCELRIYQSNDILVANPSSTEIKEVMDKIVEQDKIVKKIREGVANV